MAHPMHRGHYAGPKFGDGGLTETDWYEETSTKLQNKAVRLRIYSAGLLT